MFKKLKESGVLDVGFQAEGLCGGHLLGVRGQGGIGMFDWESGSLVRRIEVEPREVLDTTPTSLCSANNSVGVLE
jgi:coatomer subunit beta'